MRRFEWYAPSQILQKFCWSFTVAPPSQWRRRWKPPLPPPSGFCLRVSLSHGPRMRLRINSIGQNVFDSPCVSLTTLTGRHFIKWNVAFWIKTTIRFPPLAFLNFILLSASILTWTWFDSSRMHFPVLHFISHFQLIFTFNSFYFLQIEKIIKSWKLIQIIPNFFSHIPWSVYYFMMWFSDFYHGWNFKCEWMFDHDAKYDMCC